MIHYGTEHIFTTRSDETTITLKAGLGKNLVIETGPKTGFCAYLTSELTFAGLTNSWVDIYTSSFDTTYINNFTVDENMYFDYTGTTTKYFDVSITGSASSASSININVGVGINGNDPTILNIADVQSNVAQARSFSTRFIVQLAPASYFNICFINTSGGSVNCTVHKLNFTMLEI